MPDRTKLPLQPPQIPDKELKRKELMLGELVLTEGLRHLSLNFAQTPHKPYLRLLAPYAELLH
jgi:hypothetical protein